MNWHCNKATASGQSKLCRNNFWCHSCTKPPFVAHSDSSVHDVVILLPNKWLWGRVNTTWPDTDVGRQKHFSETWKTFFNNDQEIFCENCDYCLEIFFVSIEVHAVEIKDNYFLFNSLKDVQHHPLHCILYDHWHWVLDHLCNHVPFRKTNIPWRHGSCRDELNGFSKSNQLEAISSEAHPCHHPRHLVLSGETFSGKTFWATWSAHARPNSSLSYSLPAS